MAYELRCDSCDLQQTCPDWPAANRRASDHEAEYPTHWVTIYDLQHA